MRKNVLIAFSAAMLTGSLCAQSVTNGQFNGSTGFIQSSSAGSPWQKGCAYNSGVSNPAMNHPEVKQNGGNNYVELTGDYDAYAGNPYINMESIAQNVGPIPAGEYTVTFDARNYLQNTGNPGLQLMISLKNYTGCSWEPTAPPNTEELNEYVSIPLVYNFNSYSATFCVPQNLHNQLNILEFGVTHQFDNSISCDGVIDLDNISLNAVSYGYDLSYDYKIDCLTGLVKVKPTSTLDLNLHEMFILVENNPNDPNNQSDVGDVTHEEIYRWGYTIDAQGWYTFSVPLDQGKNYYVKRGIWGDCMSWVELRKFNLELTPEPLISTFDFEINCNELLQPILSVTGADQNGYNPHHMFTLYEYFPGTNTPDQTIEHIGWQQQNNSNGYFYDEGPFTFNTALDPNKHYYVKRGVWNACTSWKETRRYDIDPVACDPDDVCDIYITPLQSPCFDACGSGKWLSEFAINPNSICYNAIDYVVFNTVNNHPFGPTFTDYAAPYVVPYCTNGNYNVTATIHYYNGTTSTASYFHPVCFDPYSVKSAAEDKGLSSEEITLYPNPANDILNIETDLAFDALQLYSMDGKFIATYTSNSVNVEKLAAGTYLLKIVKGESVLSTQRFIKE